MPMKSWKVFARIAPYASIARARALRVAAKIRLRKMPRHLGTITLADGSEQDAKPACFVVVEVLYIFPRRNTRAAKKACDAIIAKIALCVPDMGRCLINLFVFNAKDLGTFIAMHRKRMTRHGSIIVQIVRSARVAQVADG